LFQVYSCKYVHKDGGGGNNNNNNNKTAAAAASLILAQRTTCLKAFLGSLFRQPITFMSYIKVEF